MTGAIVNVDEFKVHENQDGSVDKTRTDLYLHFVDRRDHSIMEVNRVLNLVDQNIERLDKLFKVCCMFCVQNPRMAEGKKKHFIYSANCTMYGVFVSPCTMLTFKF